MQALGYLALIVLGLFLSMQWWMKLKAQRVSGQPLPEIEGEMAERLMKRGKVLIYFFSPRCRPCRAMTPVIDRLSKEHDNVFKIDVSEDVETARKFHVMATPTIMVISPTMIEQVVLGAVPESKLTSLLA